MTTTLRFIRNEIKTIKEVTDDFCLIAVKAGDWNADLSPWKAPAVFGSEDFGDGAGETLKEVLKLCTENSKDYYFSLDLSDRCVYTINKLLELHIIESEDELMTSQELEDRSMTMEQQ